MSLLILLLMLIWVASGLGYYKGPFSTLRSLSPQLVPPGPLVSNLYARSGWSRNLVVQTHLRLQWWGSGLQFEEGDPIPGRNPRCVMASKDLAGTWENSKGRGSRRGGDRSWEVRKSTLEEMIRNFFARASAHAFSDLSLKLFLSLAWPQGAILAETSLTFRMNQRGEHEGLLFQKTFIRQCCRWHGQLAPQS